jgi:hypothetical protein
MFGSPARLLGLAAVVLVLGGAAEARAACLQMYSLERVGPRDHKGDGTVLEVLTDSPAPHLLSRETRSLQPDRPWVLNWTVPVRCAAEVRLFEKDKYKQFNVLSKTRYTLIGNHRVPFQPGLSCMRFEANGSLYLLRYALTPN